MNKIINFKHPKGQQLFTNQLHWTQSNTKILHLRKFLLKKIVKPSEWL